MSGKRGVTSPAASPSASAGSPSSEKQRKTKPSVEKMTDSDDPFDVAAPVTHKVVQLLAKPVKGKLHRIICPMCETAGFQSTKAAGREVRCAKKECLVPIFTAPVSDIEQKREAADAAAEALVAESQSTGLSIAAYIGIAVVAAGVLAGGAFYFTAEPEKKELSFEEQMALKGRGNTGTTIVSPGGPNDPETNTTPDKPDGSAVTQPPVGPPVAEMRNTALQLMNHTSLLQDRNQRKPFCRRLTAEAFAIAGDFDGVMQQLTQLDKVGPQLKYYRIQPLVFVAWSRLQAGNSVAATAAVTEALPLVDDLPTFGTLATDTVTELSTLLVAMDRTSEAAQLLAQRNDAGALGQFMESRSRAESTGRQSFDNAVSLRPVTGWSAPQWVAVTVSLTARGMSDKAIAWAKQAPDQSAIEDCLSGWAEAELIAAGDDTPLAEIEGQIQSLSNTAISKILSRCALALHGLGKPTMAAAPLAKARQLLGTAGAPFTIDLLSLKQNSSLKLPDTLAILQKALAATELAHAEAALGQADEAWKSVLLAMDFTRTMAPGLTLADRPFGEIKQKGDSAVTDELKSLNNLLTDDEARIAYQNYRNRARQLLNAAQERFKLQEQILTEVVQWGFATQIWSEIQQRATNIADVAAQEPWFNSNLVKAVYNDFRANNLADKGAEVEAAVTRVRLDELSAPRVIAYYLAAKRATGKTPADGAEVLANFLRAHNEEADKRWQQETMLRLVSRLVAAGRLADAFKLVAAIQDVQTRELAYELTGIEATARGQFGEVYDHARTADIIPPEKVALLRGFIGQLPAK
ncbi:MAG: hypothetical protein O3B86_03395 [Planctomycetota bacterium]|nr:hypothetical protein [Planctomycetota bacterium]